MSITLGHVSRVRNFAATDRPDLGAFQRYDGNGLAVQRDEFHLECRRHSR